MAVWFTRIRNVAYVRDQSGREQVVFLSLVEQLSESERLPVLWNLAVQSAR